MDYSEFSLLVVDDEAPYRKFMKIVVEKNFNCKVFEAKNPKDAFEILDNNKISLVLLDMQMPYMDGLTALKIIRDTITTTDTPVIACTALSNADLLVKLFKLSISDYIVKPATEYTVVTKIKRIFDKLINKESTVAQINLEQIEAISERPENQNIIKEDN